jgi:hypothetical protein
MKTESRDIISQVQDYLAQYLVFPDSSFSFVAALWAAMTYVWPEFDALPYMVINAATKQSGKSRFKEVLSFACSNALRATAISTAPATVFGLIEDRKPTLFVDEAESLSKASAGPLRELMNGGYRRGEEIVRKVGKKFVTFHPYCPKCFVLIGDVNDTLRDRSIILTMRRANREPPKWFDWTTAEAEGADLGQRLQSAVSDALLDIRHAKDAGPIRFLMNREAEIWAPLFALCAALCPQRTEELQRAAVDFSAEKTQEARRYTELDGAEDAARDDVYAAKLLQNVVDAFNGDDKVFTADLLERLYANPIAPWRKYRGTGLTPNMLSDMLSRFGVKPTLIRIGGRKGKVARGYTKDSVTAGLVHVQ